MTVEQRLTALEEQVSFLMKNRPGRRLRPIVVSEPHQCGLDPSRDSASCADASLWRKSNGCKGDACLSVSAQYYKDYRAKKKEFNGKDQD